MRPLILVLSAVDPDRLRTAIGVAAAHVVHGGAARLHLDAAATRLLNDPTKLRDLEEAAALGIVVSLCPTGLADARVDAALLSDAERFGLVALTALLSDDTRLIVL